ncbi:MAG: hypothetical protein ACPF8S_04265 [Schleiferiaceae bacterium]
MLRADHNPIELNIKGDHILFEPDQVEKMFGRVTHAYVAIDSDKNRINISSVANTWFTKVHAGAAQMMLKQRNLDGIRSLNIRPFIIDLDIEDLSAVTIDSSFSEKTGLIQIELNE